MISKQEAKKLTREIKIFVSSEQESEKIQIKLQDLGCNITLGGKDYVNLLERRICNTSLLYIYVNQIGVIRFGVDQMFFNEHKYREVTPEFILNLEWEGDYPRRTQPIKLFDTIKKVILEHGQPLELDAKNNIWNQKARLKVSESGNQILLFFVEDNEKEKPFPMSSEGVVLDNEYIQDNIYQFEEQIVGTLFSTLHIQKLI